MTLYIIANPHAGNRQAEKFVRIIKEQYHTQKVIVCSTRRRDDEAYQVEQVLKKFQKNDSLMVIGGDGTLSKVLFHLPMTLPFAYIPVGSGNDFARALKLPDLQHILAAIDQKRSLPITIFKYEKGVLLNSLDLGFAAWVVNEAADSPLKHFLNRCHLGKLIYLIVAIQSLLKNPVATLEMKLPDGSCEKLVDHFFFSVANNTYFGGGIMIWPTATALSDHLDIVFAEGRNFAQRLRTLLALLCHNHQKSPFLKHKQVNELALFLTKRSLVEIDGEIVELDRLRLVPQTRHIYM